MAGLTGSVTMWIDAFIPRDVAGYTKLLTTGTHKGKTAIPLPGAARFNPLNTLKDWNAGYLSDQRTYDTSPTSSVRMRSLAVVQLWPTFLTSEAHKSSGTTQINVESGDQTGFAVADMSRCSFSGIPSFRTQAPTGNASPFFPTPQFPGQMNPFPNAPPPTTPQTAKLSVVGAAGDPLVHTAADIDYEGVFTITMDFVAGRLTVAFDGKIDDFPAFECYASFDGATKLIFKADPPPGNTVTNLLGSATRPKSGTVTFP
jgi:hypothetical protein